MQHQKKRFRLGKGEIFSAFILAIVWFFLTRGTLLSWSIGIPAIIFSLWVKHLLVKQSSFGFSILAVFPFMIFFVQQSLLGGIDVAWRSIRPSCCLSPCLITYRFGTSNEIARSFFTNVVSLLPGTLSVDMFADGVLIHLLDESISNEDNLKRLESKIVALFGERIVYV